MLIARRLRTKSASIACFNGRKLAALHVLRQSLTTGRVFLLHLIVGTSFPHPSLIPASPSKRPSFEHAGLTCHTLLSPSITLSLFLSELKAYLFVKYFSPPILITLAVLPSSAITNNGCIMPTLTSLPSPLPIPVGSRCL